MTQVINKKLMKCCDQCHKYMNGACAWLSLGNEYCTEIMETQKVIDQLTNNWNELEEWLESVIEEDKNLLLHLKAKQDKEILDKMKEIQNGDEDEPK